MAFGEANDLADFFMLGDLQNKLAKELEKKLGSLIFRLQHDNNLSNAKDLNATAFGDGVSQANFWDCFFEGVIHVYSSMHETSTLLDVFVRFEVRTLESVEYDSSLDSGIKKEPRFIADVFCKIKHQRGCRPFPSEACGEYGWSIPVHDGSYIAEINWCGDVLLCSDCAHGLWRPRMGDRSTQEIGRRFSMTRKKGGKTSNAQSAVYLSASNMSQLDQSEIIARDRVLIEVITATLFGEHVFHTSSRPFEDETACSRDRPDVLKTTDPRPTSRPRTS